MCLLCQREKEEEKTGCVVLERASTDGEANVCVFCGYGDRASKSIGRSKEQRELPATQGLRQKQEEISRGCIMTLCELRWEAQGKPLRNSPHTGERGLVLSVCQTKETLKKADSTSPLKLYPVFSNPFTSCAGRQMGQNLSWCMEVEASRIVNGKEKMITCPS